MTSGIETLANADTERRLDLLRRTSTLRGETLVSAAELFCYAAERRPYDRLPLRLEAATSRVWTKVLFDLVARRSPELSLLDLGNSSKPSLESVLIASALERLGGGTLDEPALRMLLGRFVKSAETVTVLLRQNKQVLWAVDKQPIKRIVIAVIPESSEMTEKWPLPPQTCLCLVISAEELRAIHMFTAKEMTTHFKQPVRLAVEHSLVNDSKVGEFIKERNVEALVMFPRGMAGDSSRHIVDPQSADELWSA